MVWRGADLVIKISLYFLFIVVLVVLSISERELSQQRKNRSCYVSPELMGDQIKKEGYSPLKVLRETVVLWSIKHQPEQTLKYLNHVFRKSTAGYRFRTSAYSMEIWDHSSDRSISKRGCAHSRENKTLYVYVFERYVEEFRGWLSTVNKLVVQSEIPSGLHYVSCIHISRTFLQIILFFKFISYFNFKLSPARLFFI